MYEESRRDNSKHDATIEQIRKVNFPAEEDTTHTTSEKNLKKIQRPIYKGVRPYTSITQTGGKELKNQYTTGVSRTHSAYPVLGSVEDTSSAYYTSQVLEKSILQRNFNANHPTTEIPDLRASRDARKPLLEKRHHVPEAENRNFYSLR